MIAPNVIDTTLYTATIVPTIGTGRASNVAGITLYLYTNDTENPSDSPFSQVTIEFQIPPIEAKSLTHLFIVHMFKNSDIVKICSALESEMEGNISHSDFQHIVHTIFDSIVINSIQYAKQVGMKGLKTNDRTYKSFFEMIDSFPHQKEMPSTEPNNKQFYPTSSMTH